MAEPWPLAQHRGGELGVTSHGGSHPQGWPLGEALVRGTVPRTCLFLRPEAVCVTRLCCWTHHRRGCQAGIYHSCQASPPCAGPSLLAKWHSPHKWRLRRCLPSPGLCVLFSGGHTGTWVCRSPSLTRPLHLHHVGHPSQRQVCHQVEQGAMAPSSSPRVRQVLHALPSKDLITTLEQSVFLTRRTRGATCRMA